MNAHATIRLPSNPIVLITCGQAGPWQSVLYLYKAGSTWLDILFSILPLPISALQNR